MKYYSRAAAIQLIVALLGLAVSGQDKTAAIERQCPIPNLRTDIRPGEGGPPTKVSVGIRLIDLLEINDVKQTISVDLGIIRTWTDPRLADLNGCEISVDAIWFPDLLLRNSGRVFEKWPKKVSIYKGGKVVYLQRIHGMVASYHSLKDFPFDKQAFKIQFIPLRWSDKEILISNNANFTGLTDNLNISSWIISDAYSNVLTRYVDSFGKSHYMYEFVIKAKRIRIYYIWKLIMPLTAIIIMSWCVFWLSPVQFGPLIAHSSRSVLTLVAFIFAMTNMVPKLGYFTILDWFIAGSTVLVFLALLVTVTQSYLVSQERKEMAARIDHVCRIIFPLLYVILAATLFIPVAWR